jgi:hypothetical protein
MIFPSRSQNVPPALGLVSNLDRLDPAHLDSAEPDDDVPVCDEAIRDDPRPHVLVTRLEPTPCLSVAVQSGAARAMQLNLGVEQREKLGNLIALIEELDSSAHDCDVLLRHRPVQHRIMDSSHVVRGLGVRQVRRDYHLGD